MFLDLSFEAGGDLRGHERSWRAEHENILAAQTEQGGHFAIEIGADDDGADVATCPGGTFGGRGRRQSLAGGFLPGVVAGPHEREGELGWQVDVGGVGRCLGAAALLLGSRGRGVRRGLQWGLRGRVRGGRFFVLGAQAWAKQA